jgi:HSP20 family molecular chaperone IbpA
MTRWPRARRATATATTPSTSTCPGVSPDSVSLTVEQSVLTLTIPVREAAKPRSIQVTSSDRQQAVTA